MICLACHAPTPGELCRDCLGRLRPAAERLLPGGVRLVAAFEHEGAARRLIHLLKYQGVMAHARIAADLLVPGLPALPVVPVPRALSRRLRYGIDPSRTLAVALARRLEVPVVDALMPHLHTSRRAGRDHTRPVAMFRLRREVRSPVILVDDVVTTGSTVMTAIAALGEERVHLVVAANVVARVSSVELF